MNKIGILYTTHTTGNIIINNVIKCLSIVKMPIIMSAHGLDFKLPENFLLAQSHFTQRGYPCFFWQILQCLYIIEHNRIPCDWIYFLEHDVLYHPSHFETSIHENAKAMCNMNFIGLSQNGYQNRQMDSCPLHQTSMRFDFAAEHFGECLANVLRTKELPYTKEFIPFEIPDSIYCHDTQPSIHIETGYNMSNWHKKVFGN